MYCLLHSIRPKEYVRATYKSVKNNWTSYGLMENLKVDNGTDFTGRSLEDACRELKINLDFAPVRMPWYKAAIERFFGSLKTQLTGSIPGRCLQLLKESDYDPKKQSVVTLDGLQEILHHFIVDIHNQSGHTQLKSPRAEVWNHAIQSYPISIPSSDDSLKVLLGDVEERVISKTGIEFNYLFYNSDRLQLLRQHHETEDGRRRDRIRGKEKAKIKYNRNDLSVIHVFDPSTREYLAVPAINQNYTQNLSLAQHRIIQRYVTNQSQKVDIVALALAKQAIQDIVAEALKETKAAKTSKQIIKFLGTGRGENVIRSQEESLEMAEKSAHIDDIISEVEPLILNSVNSGISDFSSAFETINENDRISTQENSAQPEESKGVDSKKSTINTQTKLLPSIGENTVTRKSKSKTKSDDKKSLDKSADRESTLILEQQAPDLSAKSSLLENDSSSLESSIPEIEKQESKTKSQASVGLPQWKPRQR